jgi:hypothetical protein
MVIHVRELRNLTSLLTAEVRIQNHHKDVIVILDR